MKKTKKPKVAKKSPKKASKQKADIIELILQHHKLIKAQFGTMKDAEASLGEKQRAFKAFEKALVPHAKAEEEVLYVHMKDEEELRTDGFEGVCEHAIAENLLNEIKETSDQDEWVAKVKVLAELVEHHVKEEEEEMFKECRKELDEELLVQLRGEYESIYERYASEGAPKEKSKKDERVAPLM